MSYNGKQFRSLIVSVLIRLDKELCSDAAVNLLLGTAAQESHFGTYLRQIHGPAIGAFQMEPNTFEWLKDKYKVKYPFLDHCKCDDMEWDLSLAILMARLRYRVVRKALPDADDVKALGEYWKEFYNTVHGAGTVDEFIHNYNQFVLATN